MNNTELIDRAYVFIENFEPFSNGRLYFEKYLRKETTSYTRLGSEKVRQKAHFEPVIQVYRDGHPFTAIDAQKLAHWYKAGINMDCYPFNSGYVNDTDFLPLLRKFEEDLE